LGCPVEYGASAVQKRLQAFARHWPLRGDRLLDVGCGNGAYTTVLGRDFREVHAIDVEPQRIERFRETVAADPKFSVTVGSAEALDFADDSFDVVTAIEVLEHIVDLERALAEIRRVVRPGGAFLVSCPNRLFPLETHTVAVGHGRTYPARRVPFLPYVKPLHRRLSTARNFARRDLAELVCTEEVRLVAWDWVMPPLDHWRRGRAPLLALLDRLERSPLRVFGVSIIGIFEKAA
jgi:ubiquinone/menaquinone biosynthesis C-methylase UbiE